ncbi:hypothetical protein [Kribbella sp. VKM Ac-2568]|uniref:YunG family protein n=1 Tax=Kribbella sp. VKM Ac-2568 TaxID=2512219 RepID=UPI0010DE1B0D|nr:hypothetical protein [Kribbella sp. VKM Ac-2568]TCM48751.1 hypothetical protein EV648_10315 [Kribbella sp. VKM Ac-2568]
MSFVRSSDPPWGADTCYPDSREEWTPQNPARDQCGMTALVAQDILGGALIVGEVHVGDVQVDHHYWHRLPDGSEVDLTANQFRPDEEVVGGWAGWSLDHRTLRTVTASSTNCCTGESSKRWSPTRGPEPSHDSAAIRSLGRAEM